MTSDDIIQWLDTHKGVLQRLPVGWYACRSLETSPHVFHSYNDRGPTPAAAIAKVEAQIAKDNISTNNPEGTAKARPGLDAGSAQLSLLNLTEREAS